MTQSILINASVSVFSLVMENSQFNILNASLKHLHQPWQTLLQPQEIGSLHVDEISSSIVQSGFYSFVCVCFQPHFPASGISGQATNIYPQM